MMLRVEWKLIERTDIRPLASEVSNITLAEVAPKLLIEFYESNLKL